MKALKFVNYLVDQLREWFFLKSMRSTFIH